MSSYESERSLKENYIYHQNDVNLRFPTHLHHSFEFVTTLEGSIKIEIEGKEYQLNSGESLVIIPNQAHSYTTEDYSRTYLCVFSNDFVEDFATLVKDYVPTTPIFKLNNTNHIINTLQHHSNTYELKSELYNIISNFYSQGHFVKSEKSQSDFTHQILLYIENHFSENISLKNMANDLGYTYNYLSSIFHNLFSTDFTQIINEFRINEACKLLHDPDITILKAASLSGYDSLRTFNRNFLKIKGVTPTEYRKNIMTIL